MIILTLLKNRNLAKIYKYLLAANPASTTHPNASSSYREALESVLFSIVQGVFQKA